MTTTRKGSFSTDEDSAIYRKYGTMPTARLAQQLRRRVVSVERRVKILFQGSAMRGPWLDDETDRLMTLLGTASVAQLSLIFRRTELDVRAAVVRLRERPKSGAPLTDELLNEFRAVYSSRTDKDLSAMFGIAQEVIDSTAKTQCLQKDKAFLRAQGADVTKMPRWAQDEVSRLTTLYPAVSNHEIAQRLDRSVKSVVSKAHSLGLKKDPKRLQEMGRDNVAKRYNRR